PTARQQGPVVVQIEVAKTLVDRPGAIGEFREPDRLEGALDGLVVDLVQQRGFVRKEVVDEPLRYAGGRRQPARVDGKSVLREILGGPVQNEGLALVMAQTRFWWLPPCQITSPRSARAATTARVSAVGQD